MNRQNGLDLQENLKKPEELKTKLPGSTSNITIPL